MKKIIVFIACMFLTSYAEDTDEPQGCNKKYGTVTYFGDAEQALKSMTAVSKWLNLKEYNLNAIFEETFFTVGSYAFKERITGVTLYNSANAKVEINWATSTEWHHGEQVTVHNESKSVIRFYDEFGIEDHVTYVYYDMPKTIYKKLCRNK